MVKNLGYGAEQSATLMQGKFHFCSISCVTLGWLPNLSKLQMLQP